jgi:hypothetical protein
MSFNESPKRPTAYLIEKKIEVLPFKKFNLVNHLMITAHLIAIKHPSTLSILIYEHLINALIERS